MGTLSPIGGPRSARDRLDRVLALALRSLLFWKYALVVIVLGSAASVGVAMTRKRLYQSETIILYRETIRSSAVGDDAGGDPARRLGLRLKEIVFSRPRLQKMIDEYKLYPRIVDDLGYVQAVDEMRNHISFRVRDGDTFGLSFDGDDPKTAQKVTEKLADALIEEYSKNRVEQATVTKDFLDEEQQRAEKELKEKETAVVAFQTQHPQFTKDPNAGFSIGPGATVRAAVEAQKKASGPRDATLLALAREAMRIEERLGKPVQKIELPPAAEHKMVAEARAEVDAARRDLAEKQSVYTEQHPDVRAAQARAKAAEAKLNRWIAKAAEDTPPKPPKPVELGDKERAELEAQLSQIKTQMAVHRAKAARVGPKTPSGDRPLSADAQRIVALETEFARLNRELNDARERNQKLEDRRFRAEIAASSVTSERNVQIRVVDPAFLPVKPTTKGRKTIVLAGGAVSLFLAVALMLGLALLDERVYDRVDIERLDLAPLLAVVPRDEPRSRPRAIQRAVKRRRG